jgi:ABC-type Fe3+-hydroxamate transport system substrate-binding protein
VRIVSLCPSLTELVFDLGRGDDLVGITEYCVHPAERVGAVEKVGGTKTPDVARIIELAPDLVLLNEEENRREDHDALVAAGVPVHTSMPRTAMETAEMVHSIGVALDREPEAAAIAADIARRTALVRADAAGREPVRFAYLIWRKPWMSVSDDTFASSLLAQAGGLNVFGEREARYPEVTLDELREARPDLVLLCTEPFPFQEKHATEVAEALGLDPARVRIADGEYLSWHGSRTPDGIDHAAALIRAGR